MPVKLVAIDGHGGSGKSTLAEILAGELEAEIIHIDDFAFPNHQGKWVPVLAEKALDAIQNGAKTLSYQPSSWWPDHKPDSVVDQKVTPIMILEGVTAIRPEFKQYTAYSIYVDTPLNICISRGVERDKQQGPKAEILDLWEKWLQEEVNQFSKTHPKECASMVVDGTIKL